MGQTVGLELMARYEENRSPFRIRHAIRLDGSTARRLDGSTLVDMVDMVELTPFQVQPLATPSTVLPDELAWGNITKCPHITCRGGEDGGVGGQDDAPVSESHVESLAAQWLREAEPAHQLPRRGEDGWRGRPGRRAGIG